MVHKNLIKKKNYFISVHSANEIMYWVSSSFIISYHPREKMGFSFIKFVDKPDNCDKNICYYRIIEPLISNNFFD